MKKAETYDELHPYLTYTKTFLTSMNTLKNLQNIKMKQYRSHFLRGGDKITPSKNSERKRLIKNAYNLESQHRLVLANENPGGALKLEN